MQLWFLVIYLRFETTYRFYLQGSNYHKPEIKQGLYFERKEGGVYEAGTEILKYYVPELNTPKGQITLKFHPHKFFQTILISGP